MIKIDIKDATMLLNATSKSISTPEIKAWMLLKADKYMKRAFVEQFKTEGARFGTPWKGIRESSLEKRKGGYKKFRKSKRTGARLGGARIVSDRRVKGVHILIDSLALFNAVTKGKPRIEPYYSGLKISWGKDLVDRGKTKDKTGIKYMTHQTGSKKKNIPARPMIGATGRDVLYLIRSLAGTIGNNIRKYRR